MTPPGSATSPWRQLTGYQWLVVAWPGWVFDSMDATIYALGMLVLLKARETKLDVLR